VIFDDLAAGCIEKEGYGGFTAFPGEPLCVNARRLSKRFA